MNTKPKPHHREKLKHYTAGGVKHRTVAPASRERVYAGIVARACDVWLKNKGLS